MLGTKPRWALDYVDSLDLVMGWQPDIVLSGHVAPDVIVVDAERANPDALTLRMEILQELDRQAGNFNERAWFRSPRTRAQQALQPE